jgi:acylphosphatase
MQSLERRNIILNGKVQGVGFRFFSHELANDLQVTGWVRNNKDKSVELEAQATALILDELEKKLRKGNGDSKVTDMNSQKIPIITDETSFEIKF